MHKEICNSYITPEKILKKKPYKLPYSLNIYICILTKHGKLWPMGFEYLIPFQVRSHTRFKDQLARILKKET